jgi:lipopolysaccharide/colanic/teichoic acid biosynthesis glycosyltransferase
MLHEDFVGHPNESASPQAQRRSSGPTTLEPEQSVSPAALPSPMGASTHEALLPPAQEQPPAGRAKSVRPWKEVALVKERPGYFLAKRVLDCTLALIGLLVASPVLLVAWALVRLTSPGPAIFRQERVGFRGRRFVVFKFRSMYVDNDERLHRAAYEQFLRGERLSGKVDDTVPGAEDHPRKHKHSGVPYDPRITPLGYFLRRSSIDELPQLFNVLRGEMSLVGPRPPIAYEVKLYKEWHLGRLETLPGITGLWQVRGRSRVSFDTMVQMDIEYIAKQSFWYDLKLLFLTIPAVLSRQGAY